MAHHLHVVRQAKVAGKAAETDLVQSAPEISITILGVYIYIYIYNE